MRGHNQDPSNNAQHEGLGENSQTGDAIEANEGTFLAEIITLDDTTATDIFLLKAVVKATGANKPTIE